MLGSINFPMAGIITEYCDLLLLWKIGQYGGHSTTTWTKVYLTLTLPLEWTNMDILHIIYPLSRDSREFPTVPSPSSCLRSYWMPTWTNAALAHPYTHPHYRKPIIICPDPLYYSSPLCIATEKYIRKQINLICYCTC